MRSAFALLSLSLLPGVWCLPYGDSCHRPHTEIVTAYSTEVEPTSTPEPSTTFVPESSSTEVEPTSTAEPLTTFVPESSSTEVEPTSTAEPSTTSVPESSSTPEPNPTSSCRPPWGAKEGRAPSTETLRAAVIFVDFPDSPANTSIEDAYAPISSAPAELYDTMSYGKLSLELVPVLDQWYRMPAESSSYNYSRGLTTELHLKYINDALTAVGPSFSFENIDVLYVIAAPYADEIGFSTSTSVDVIAADGSTIGISITYGQDLHFTWGYKTINHETGHAMGLPDLYAEEDNTKYVGGFDLMGLIAGQSPDYFAWHKWQLGWVDDSQVECAVDAGKTTYRIGPIEVAGEAAKAVAIPITSTQYVMAEVRSTLGIDSDACGTGVLLYTADSAIGSGDGPVRIIDANENSGGCKPDVGGEMNDAPFGVEQVWAGEGVTVRVVEKVDDDYIIEVERAE